LTATKVITGHNHQSTVVAVSPQPARKEPLHHGRINRVPGGLTYPEGYLQTHQLWNVRERADYPIIMAQYGLSLTTTSALITIAMDDDYGNYKYYNAVASYDQDAQREMNFWKRLEIKINKMEEVAAP